MSKRCFTKIALLKRWNFGIILHFVFPLTLHTVNNVFLFFDFWDSEPVILKITVFKGTFSMLGIKRKGKTSKTYGTRLSYDFYMQQNFLPLGIFWHPEFLVFEIFDFRKFLSSENVLLVKIFGIWKLLTAKILFLNIFLKNAHILRRFLAAKSLRPSISSRYSSLMTEVNDLCERIVLRNINAFFLR